MAAHHSPALLTGEAPGWYGKLLSLGDFAQQRLPPHWVKVCDAWLAKAMRSGQEHLGPRWLEVYLTAPPLRFAWAPGVIDDQWWFGLMMPSCDNVGRYFPLLIAQPRARPPEDRIALDHLELWYEHLAQAAVQTLAGNGGSVQGLEQALHETPPWPTPGYGVDTTAAAVTLPGRHLSLGRPAPLSHWLHTLAAGDLTLRLAGCSLWWRTSEPGAEDAIDIVKGLPEGAQFVGLFSGAGVAVAAAAGR